MPPETADIFKTGFPGRTSSLRALNQSYIDESRPSGGSWPSGIGPKHASDTIPDAQLPDNAAGKRRVRSASI